MNPFWNGFLKQAAKEEAPPSGQNMVKWDAQGGVSPRTPEAMQMAQAVDLKTLPKDLAGPNCGNCMYVRVVDNKKGTGFCTRPEVNQDVTDRMLCSLWDAPGVLRSYETEDRAHVDPNEAGNAAEEIGNDFQNPEMSADEQAAMEEQATMGHEGAEGQEAAPKPKKPAKKEKKEEGGKAGKHTININLGKGGK